MATLVHDPVISDGRPAVVRLAPARERWSWALYDFANTIFSMNIATLYFAVWLVSDLRASNTMVALGNGIASALAMVSLPIFGAISDTTRRRKPWVVWFTIAAVLATISMGVIGQTMIPLVGDSVLVPAAITDYRIGGPALVAVLTAFVIANYAYQGALPFYNAMMADLAPKPLWGRLSGMGTALGYIGSIAGVLMITPFFNGKLPVGGPVPEPILHTLRAIFPFTSVGGRVSTFAPTGVVFLLFSLPLFFFCRDHYPVARGTVVRWRHTFANAFTNIRHTLRDAKQYPGAIRFLIASFLYQDAIGTIISYMALYAVVAMGFQRGAETTLFVILTIPAVIGSWVWGRITDRIGPKHMLLWILLAWVILLVALILIQTQKAFWVVGAVIGFIYGGVSVAERPLLLHLVPEREAGRFFGLMVLSARAAAIVGPFIWGFAVDGLTPRFGTALAYRAAVGTVAIAMLVAFTVLRGVPVIDKR